MREIEMVPKEQKRTHKMDMCRLVIALTVLATVAMRNWVPVVYGLQALMILLIIGDLASKRIRVSIGKYTGFYAAFFFWCLLSVFWSASPESALSASIGIFQIVVLGTFITAYVVAHDCPDFLFDCLAWSGIALIAVLAVVTPLSVWQDSLHIMADASSDQNRLGYTVGYHPNALAIICAVCSVMWVHKVTVSPRNRLRGMFAIACLVAVLICTKSRLSILILVACFVLYFLIAKRNSKWFVIVIPTLFLTLAAIVWAVMNVPALYDVVGFRFAAMFGVSGSVDASTLTRVRMTEIAFDLFKRRPINGVGFENFSYYYFSEYSGWAATYAHNTYAELLADLGVVGVILYYAIPVWIFATLVRCFKAKNARNGELYAILTVLSTSQLIADYASISYRNDFTQLMIMCLFCYATRFKTERLQSASSRNADSRMSV